MTEEVEENFMPELPAFAEAESAVSRVVPQSSETELRL